GMLAPLSTLQQLHMPNARQIHVAQPADKLLRGNKPVSTARRVLNRGSRNCARSHSLATMSVIIDAVVYHWGAAAMKARIAVLASVVLSGSATAAPNQYAVEGVAVGTQLNFDSASYREYKCSPSQQFDGLTWCQKARANKDRRRPYTAAYSLL